MRQPIGVDIKAVLEKVFNEVLMAEYDKAREIIIELKESRLLT
jgi:hypothetical protein